jgi:hypothetical protein
MRFANLVLMAATVIPLGACHPDKLACRWVACDGGGAEQRSCGDQRESRLLLDNFVAPIFDFDRVRAGDGTPIVPAVFNWHAPESANEVTCALFTSMPTFSCEGMTNFQDAVALFDLRQFTSTQSRVGAFDLAAARSQPVRPSASFRAAGCWASSFVDIVGATALIDLTPADLPPDALGTAPGGAGP